MTELARSRGDEVAVIFAPVDGDEQQVRWSELERRSNQVARLLARRGAGEGDVVVVATRSAPEHCFATFGAWKLGASVLPLRHDLPEWESSRLLELAHPEVVVADWVDGAAAALSSAEIQATVDESDEPLPDRVPACARLVATSGSTGRPKIIVTPAPGLHEMASGGALLATGTEGSGRAVHLTASPLYHTNGYASSYRPLLDGDRIVLMERFDAARAVDLVERHGVTHLLMVPTMLQRIARLPDVGARDFSSVERVMYGGASIPEWVVRAWLELVPPERFWLTYGASEAVGLFMTTGREWLEHPGSSGRALNCAVKILDGGGVELPAGQVGEIHMRPLETTPTFRYVGSEMPTPTEDGFLSLGDMGWLDEDGFLYVVDRRQDMIVTGGANVFPAEVEAALSEHPAVGDVVVVGLEDPEWGRRVHAVVQLVDGAVGPTEEELRRHSKQRLSAYKVPKSFELVETIPRSAAGKVNRSAVAAECAERWPAGRG